MRWVPIAAARIGAGDVLAAAAAVCGQRGLVHAGTTLRGKLNRRHAYLTDSCTSALYVALVALQSGTKRNQVIVPAYTADSVAHAVKKASLVPVFCDVSRDDFNMDLDPARKAVTEKTLAIIGVHAFGVVSAGLGDLKREFPDVFLIEDCAQAMGSRVGGEYAGNAGDVSVFSFNRGKNLPAYGGGAITTNSKELAERVEWAFENVPVGKRPFDGLTSLVKLAALAAAVRPGVYGLIRPFPGRLRERPTPGNFGVYRCTASQAGAVTSLLGRLEEESEARYRNGTALMEGLKELDGVSLPAVAENTRPAFNRLPVLFQDTERRERAAEALRAAGIETSRMYPSPLANLPHARYVSEHLLTVPTHPLLNEADVTTIMETVKACT